MLHAQLPKPFTQHFGHTFGTFVYYGKK
jgi:hypothetical protein